jgi:hypothetical protein
MAYTRLAGKIGLELFKSGLRISRRVARFTRAAAGALASA